MHRICMLAGVAGELCYMLLIVQNSEQDPTASEVAQVRPAACAVATKSDKPECSFSCVRS